MAEQVVTPPTDEWVDLVFNKRTSRPEFWAFHSEIEWGSTLLPYRRIIAYYDPNARVWTLYRNKESPDIRLLCAAMGITLNE